jgi:hypothetical protein
MSKSDLFVCGVLLIVSSQPTRSQEARGTVLGRVTDRSDAVVPGVSVRITNKATGIATAVETNEQGNYLAPYLIPSIYQVTAEKSGFKRFLRDGIELRLNDRLEVNILLELGDLTDTVTVTAETPLLETASASQGQVVDSRRVAELPIPHGMAYALIQLAPGVAYAAAESVSDRPFEPTSIIGYTMDGTRSNRSEVILDGVPNTSTGDSRNQVIAAWVPPADTVAEFKVQTASFDATVGNTEGGVVNISLKSGGNALHGTAYYSKMDPVLTANLFSSNRTGRPRGDFTYGRWGGMSSGPVLLPRIYDGRNRTFFMYGYEGIHANRPRGQTLTVPTAKEREGDFSGLLAVGSRYQIYDPGTRRAVAGGRFQSDPFAGNVVPPARISPIARNLLKFYALPTAQGTADGQNNLPMPDEPEKATYYTYTIRLDHNVSSRHRIFSRVNVYKSDMKYNDWFKNVSTGRLFNFLSRGAAFDDVYSFSPTLVMNLRYGYNRYVRTYDGKGEAVGFDLTTLGFPASWNNATDPSIRRFPRFTIAGYTATYPWPLASNSISTLWRPTDTHNFTAAFDKISGAHSLKFGLEYRIYRENQYSNDNTSTGQIDFGATWTAGPLDNSPASPIGQGLASLLLGLPTGGRAVRQDSYAEESTVWAPYFQDDWKITRRLTLTLGLRYELEGPLTERFNRTIRGLDYAASLPIETQVKANYARNPTPEVAPDQFRVRGGLTFAGVNGQPRTLWERDSNNFMPRIGFAYNLAGKTVLRGGYGVFFGFLGTRRGDVIQTGFSQETTLIPSLDGGLTFVATLANPFPNGILDPLGAKLGAMTNVGQAVTFINTKPLAPYMQRWQLSLQREFPHRIVLDAGYVGNRGTHVETTRDLDAVPIQYLSRSGVRDDATINYLTTNLPNPFYPLLPGTGRAGTLIPRYSLLTGYPQFTSLTTTTNEGYSWYHSLQVKVEKRFSAGYTLQAAYTRSKLMEAIDFLNPGDPAPARTISDQDYPQRITISGIYELPFGRGRRWASGARGVAGVLLGNWQVQGVYGGQSAQALGFGNAIFNGDAKNIPLPRGQRTVERWFNTAAGFERNTRNQLSYNLRAFPLRFSGVRADGINNWDLSLIKDAAINERMKIQFRGEFLNALNHAQFSNPNTDPYSTTFGVITSERANPRRIQLGIKFVY